MVVLNDAQKDLTYDERQTFDQVFIGALSVHASAENWASCIETATRVIKLQRKAVTQ